MRQRIEQGPTIVEVGGRASGKTIQAVEWLKEDDDRILMVFSLHEKERIRKQWGLTPEQADRIIVSGDLAELRGRPDRELGVDNLDMITQDLLDNLTTSDVFEMLTGIRPAYGTMNRGPNQPAPRRRRGRAWIDSPDVPLPPEVGRPDDRPGNRRPPRASFGELGPKPE